jgi:hypothetical protein
MPLPTPDRGKGNPANSALRSITDASDRRDDDIAEPVQLFAAGTESNVQSDDDAAAAAGTKRLASPRRASAAPAESSPAKKKTNTAASPVRAIIHGALNAVVRGAHAVAATIVGVEPPPAIHRTRPSPASIATLDPVVFPPAPDVTPAPAAKRKGGHAMIGLIPKTQLLPWLRNPAKGTKNNSLTEAQMRRQVQTRRTSILYQFSKTGKVGTTGEDDDDLPSGPLTRVRSSASSGRFRPSTRRRTTSDSALTNSIGIDC